MVKSENSFISYLYIHAIRGIIPYTTSGNDVTSDSTDEILPVSSASFPFNCFESLWVLAKLIFGRGSDPRLAKGVNRSRVAVTSIFW